MENDKNFFRQNTLKEKISISGLGLFTGKKTKVNIYPAKEDHGIVFKRIDKKKSILWPANLKYVQAADRTTSVGFDEKKVQTVEHLLSALAASKIDNALIEVDGSEIPILDGSAKYFVEAIDAAGMQKQTKEADVLKLLQPVYFSEKDIHLIALPSNEYRISFTIHHPSNKFLRSQYFSYLVEKDSYAKEIASSRTYCIYEEIQPLLDNKLIKGGSLNNAVVIKNEKVLNSLRFEDEMVRHKILDLIGDFCLIGNRFLAHIIAIKSGHFANINFAKKLINHLEKKIIYEYTNTY